MNSAGFSSFWFQQDETPVWGTEIDVFEIGGKAKGFENKYNMAVHVFQTPKEKKHWQVNDVWLAPWRLADDYHVYGLEWSKQEIKYFVDGVLVRSVENTHWHQPLYLIFDSETMPQMVRDAGGQRPAIHLQRRVCSGVEEEVVVEKCLKGK